MDFKNIDWKNMTDEEIIEVGKDIDGQALLESLSREQLIIKLKAAFKVLLIFAHFAKISMVELINSVMFEESRLMNKMEDDAIKH